MRRTLIDNGARKALAVLASAALVAGLVPAAAFGEVGGGSSVADAASNACLAELGAQVGEGSSDAPGEGSDASGAGSVSGSEAGNASAIGNENGAPGGSNASDGSDNEGSFSSSDAGDLSSSSSGGPTRDGGNVGPIPGGSAGAPDTGDAPSAPEPPAPETFTDVEPGSWYEPGVLFCQQKKIMRGIAGTTLFGVGQSLTRAQMAAMMWRYADPEAADPTLATPTTRRGWTTLSPGHGTPLQLTGRSRTR